MIGVVHLVWAPLGPQPLRDFLASYARHDAGAEHELVVLLNGAEEGSAEPLLEELAGVPHRLLATERPLQDLAAYGYAARHLSHEHLCFLNSYAVIHADGWLAYLERALSEADVGVVGASGNWESLAEWRRGPVLNWPKQLAGLAAVRADYPRFPNPHVRTNAFMIARRTLLDLGLDSVHDKPSAYLMESGSRSITRRIQERGLQVRVVGRDGRAYDIEDWPASRTFRSGGQENLLISDNQTRAFSAAPPRLRRRLARDSWGSPRARRRPLR